jgi:hypothetical protein
MDHFRDKWLIPLIVSCFALLAPIHSILLAVGILIFGDATLGVWAARKRGDKITSSRLRDTVSKMLIYHAVLVLGFIVERYLVHDLLPIAKLAAGAIGLVEMKSVLENASDILGKPLFKDLIQKLGSKNRDKLPHN